jgi:hypothetical protein
MFRTIVTLCALVGAIHAQNATYQAPQYAWPNMGPAMGAAQAIAGVHAQEQMANKYAAMMLDFQATMSLGQAAHGMIVSGVSAAKADASGNADLEEEEFHPMLGGFAGKELSDDELDQIELQVEHSLMYFTKLMFLQGAKKLSTAQRDHYQSKIQMMMLQGLGQHPFVSQFLHMMYYRDMLETFSSSIALLRQDAWSFWLFNDLMETVEFDNGRSMSDAFANRLATSKTQAHNLYLIQATLDLQMLYLDNYMTMLVSQAFGAPAGSSFLEEEVEAEPSKPFTPFMLMGNPGYMAYYTRMLKFYSTYLNYIVASSLTSACHLDQHALTSGDDDGKASAMARSLFLHGAIALQQWAQIHFIELYLDYASMFMGAGAPPPQAPVAQQQAPNFHNFMQTDEPQASAPAAVPVPEQQAAPVAEAAAEQDPVQQQPAAQAVPVPEIPMSVVG